MKLNMLMFVKNDITTGKSLMTIAVKKEVPHRQKSRNRMNISFKCNVLWGLIEALVFIYTFFLIMTCYLFCLEFKWTNLAEESSPGATGVPTFCVVNTPDAVPFDPNQEQ